MTGIGDITTNLDLSEEEILLLAMAPLEEVLSAFASSSTRRRRIYGGTGGTPLHEIEEGEEGTDDDMACCYLGLEEQDRFAQMIRYHWHDLGPSERYLRKLIRCYVKRVEERGVVVESDGLLELILRTTHKSDAPIPNADEAGYLSFFLPPPPPPYQEQHQTPQEVVEEITPKTSSDRGKTGKEEEEEDETPLRIRVYPYHNDVALRFWEAGAGLAEFLLAHSELVSGKRVMELGAGVGATGLVLAGCSNAASVYMTDYTDVCLENMKHNIEVNTSWLRRWCRGEQQESLPQVTEGYLEWESFVEHLEKGSPSPVESEAFWNADVLIAADVIYDLSVVESLVALIRHFLSSKGKNETESSLNDCDSQDSTTHSTKAEKQAIFAITKRNIKSFETFMGHLKQYGISCQWLARGNDWEDLPLVFRCNFVQPRFDVYIAALRATRMGTAAGI